MSGGGAQSLTSAALETLSQIGFALVDEADQLCYPTASLARLMAQPLARLEGLPLPELHEAFLGSEPILAALRQGTLPSFELERVHVAAQGPELHYLHFRLSRHERGQAQQPVLLLMVEDVTERARLEQHLQQERNELRLLRAELKRTNKALGESNQFKSFLLSMLGHDLRTPLTAIIGFTSLLLDDPSGSEAERIEFLGTIERQAERASALLDSLLELGQIEQGKLQLNLERVDLLPLIREATTPLLAQRSPDAILLELPTQPLWLHGDAMRLQQVVGNLLSNALKYGGERAPVRCEARQVMESGQPFARLTVRDQGPGISAEQRALIFQPYYRSEQARRSTVRGTGLGLFIVKTLVEAHRGQVRVESEPGQGTSFTLFLPLADDDETV